MGVMLDMTTIDPDGDAVASLEYRRHGESYRPGHPPSRVVGNRLVGSLFWLEPDTAYDVRITVHDPDTGKQIFMDTAITRAEITIPPPLRTLYAAPDGSGIDCTVDSPCALGEAIQQGGAGVEIVLRGGTYYAGGFKLSSGTADNPFVIRAYEGETPILDGSDPADLNWTHQGGGVYLATANASTPSIVAHDGYQLFRYSSLSDLQSLRWDVPGFYANKSSVYVRLANDADPNTARMSITRYATGLDVEQWAIIDGLTFRYFSDKALSLYDSDSDNVIQNCTFHVNTTGIALKYSSHRNVIQHNKFFDNVADFPWDGVYAGGGSKYSSLRFASSTPPKGNVIRWNTVHGAFDGMNVCSYEFGKTSLSETDVYENVFSDIGDDAIQADGQCGNVRVWGNIIDDVLHGISFAPVEIGPVYAVRNLITNYRISPIKTGSSDGTSGEIYLYHNTAVGTANAYGLQFDKGSDETWKLIRSRNNIWAGARQHGLRNVGIDQPCDLDYDNITNNGTTDLIRWGYEFYTSLTEFAAATGQELNGLSVAPGFVDAASGDYGLTADSPLVDAGCLIPGINDDYTGGAPDLGAIEYPLPMSSQDQ